VDKQIRRRRAVLLLLVLVSLILLTDYFGESSNSPLHSVQRGIVEVLSPVQDGASKVLSPVRDVAGFVSSTADAKSQLASLKKQYNSQKEALASLAAQERDFEHERTLIGLDQSYHLKSYGLKPANVVEQNSLLWYETIKIDKGTNAGIRPNDPVVGPGGLVGAVSSQVGQIGPSYAVVNLLTSPNFAVGAMVAIIGASAKSDSAGLIQPKVGNPSTLVLQNLPTTAQVGNGDLVVTSGFKDPSQPIAQSFAPPGIPIGNISSEDPQTGVQTSGQVDVSPSADLTHLSVVQVLTKPHAGA
jgi:rod shape-determining protein MreC